MFSSEVRSLLVQVITSWQVLAVTVVLVIYIFLVNYVAKIQNRRRMPKLVMPKIKKLKPEKTAEPVVTADSGSEETPLEEEDGEA